MPKPQSAASHAAGDPAFVAAGLVLIINFILAVTYTIRQWPIHSRSHLWWIVMSVVWIVMHAKIRNYALKNQDRTIRLEERIRYAALLNPAEQNAAAELTLRQTIALRFASDAELPALIRRALAESLPPKEIKAAISTWRPDYNRV